MYVSTLKWWPVHEVILRTLQRKSPFLLFIEKELRGFSPNFHIQVSASDLYIPGISPHISYSRIGRPIVGIYKSFTDTWMWKLGVRPSNSFSVNICFEFLVLCLCSEAEMKKRLYRWWPEVYQPKAFLPQMRVKWQKMPPQVGTRRLTIWRRRRKTSAGELMDKMSPLHRRNYFKEITR
jgi:hypothetical protein